MIDVARIQVIHLELGDVFHLSTRYASDFFLVRNRRTLGDVRSLLQQHRRWRTLRDELERTVAINRDHDRNHHSAGFLRPLVELLNELTKVNTVLTKRSADRRSRGSLPARNLKLRAAYKLLCHDPKPLLSANIPVPPACCGRRC